MSDRKSTKEPLDLLTDELKDLSRTLGELNGAFPATKAFLDRCGATSVNDLDAQGLKDLKAHLEAELKLALAERKEPSQA